MKVDVEGAAGEVLRGAARLLDQHGPAVFLEIHGPQEQAAARDELQARGYRLETLDGTPVGDPTASWVSPLWCTKAPRTP
jgi:hypothetical protein